MENIKKRFMAISICLAVLFCCLAPAQEVDAAAKKVNMTVCYKGKKVTFAAYHNAGGSVSTSNPKFTIKTTYAAVKKAWGKADKITKGGYADFCYTWKKGKTIISFDAHKDGKPYGNLTADINDKNF